MVGDILALETTGAEEDEAAETARDEDARESVWFLAPDFFSPSLLLFKLNGTDTVSFCKRQ